MNTLLIVILGLVVLYVAGLVMYLSGQKRQATLAAAHARTLEGHLFQVTVSKLNERGPLSAEQMLANIHGMYRDLSTKDLRSGRIQNRVSFEIAHINGLIYFYMWLPDEVSSLVLGQLYAQYPDIEIIGIPDYAAYFHKQVEQGLLTAQSVEMTLSKPNVYPIKKYKQFEDSTAGVIVDPLSGVLSSMVGIAHPKDQVWIQYVIQPLPDSWHDLGVKVIKAMSGGIFAKYKKKQIPYLEEYYAASLGRRIMLFPFFWMLSLNMMFAKQSAPDDPPKKEEQISGEEAKTDTVGQSMMGKVSKLAYQTNIRAVYITRHSTEKQVEQKLRDLAGSFKQFAMPYFNGFKVATIGSGKEFIDRYLQRALIDPFVLNTEELATVVHLPTTYVNIPNIAWVMSKKLEPPSNLPLAINEPALTTLGRTNFRNVQGIFGIREDDRRRHMYIIGKTGMGKSTLLENMLYSDIMTGKGVAVIDPHGDLADAVLSFIPKHRINDVVMFSPSDVNFPVGFNMLENVDPGHRALITSGLVGVFKKLYSESWGPRLEHILRNTIMALLETQNPTMLGIMRILVDKAYRKTVIDQVQDPVVKSFWVDEFETMQEKQRTEAISPIQNKVGQFLSSPVIRNIVGQPQSSIDIRFIMDNKKILIVNLSKGLIGEDSSALLGSMMITKFQLDAMSRADVPKEQRTDFYLYVDEFQNFATDSFATILSEARKYKLNLTMANQYIAQMPDTVKEAVFGNVGTIVSFQVGPDDATYLETQFADGITAPDLVSLSKYAVYLKLLIDGMPSKTFSAATLAPPKIEGDVEQREKIIRVVRERYSRKRDFVEEKIKEWTSPQKVELKKLPPLPPRPVGGPQGPQKPSGAAKPPQPFGGKKPFRK